MHIRKLAAFGVLFLLLISFGFANAPSNSNVVAYYELDDLLDSTANNNDLTHSGTASFTSHIIGNGLGNFYANDGTFSTTHARTDDISFCGWFETNAFDSTYGFSYPSDANGDFQIRLQWIATGIIRATALTDGVGASVNADSSAGYLANTDYYVCVTYNGEGDDKIRLYIDGSLIATSSGYAGTGNDGNQFLLGANAYQGSPVNTMAGTIDEFLVYDGLLTVDEISWLYASGSPSTSQQYPFSNATAAPEDTLTITAKDIDNSTSITTFNATLPYNATVYTTTNGTIYINVTAAGGDVNQTQNVTLLADTYFTQTFYDHNISSTLIANLTQWPEVTTKNIYNNNSITNFNVTIDATTYAATGGYAYVPYNSSKSTLIQATDYFNVTVTHDYTGATDLNQALKQSDIKFTIYELITNTTLQGNLTDGINYQTNGTSFYFPTGTHTITFTKDGYFSKQENFTVAALQNETLNFSGVYDSLLKINATNARTSAVETSFNITLQQNGTYSLYGITTNGSLYFPTKKGYNYTLTVNDSAHALDTSVVYVDDTYENVTLLMSTINSILLTFIDEFTNTIINTTNMTAQLVGANSYTYTTTNGTLFAELITPSPYEIRYYSTNIDDYKLRSYFFTLTNLSFNNITLYSLNTTSEAFTKATITFQILDTSFAPVENAKVVVQRYYASENGFVSVWERLTNSEGAAVGEFETIDAFYRYLVYYGDNLEYASSTNGVQFSGDDTLTIYIDTSQDYSQGIVDIRGLKDVSNLEFQSTGNFSGFFELNYTNDNLIQICLRVSTMTDLISLECQTSASGTIQSTINAPTTRTTSYFADALGYDTNTGRLISFDSETHTFNFDELISQNSGLKSSATFVVIIILVALALILIKYPVISIIVQTVFFSIVTLSPLPLVVGGIQTTIAWLVTLTITGVYILMRGKDG